jgi:hypothetical protein
MLAPSLGLDSCFVLDENVVRRMSVPVGEKEVLMLVKVAVATFLSRLRGPTVTPQLHRVGLLAR